MPVHTSCAGPGRAGETGAFFAARARKNDGPGGIGPPSKRGLVSNALAVVLQSSRAQTGQAVLVDRSLPAKEFLDREGVAFARFFQ